MDNLTIAAASGLRSRMESLDLLANNLANSATNGFKRDQEFYGVLFFRRLGRSDERQAPKFQRFPRWEKQWTDFSQGTIQVTGNPLDIALSGNGFLAVNGPNGTLYTRAGSLKVLASGVLATNDGYTLRSAAGGTIKVAANSPITITPEGSVQQAGQPVGQIAVDNFKSTNSLRKMGGTYFQNTDTRNPAMPTSNVVIQQGKIEGSNVPVAEAAMRLVGVMRQFEMLQKAVGVSNDMDTKTIQEVARVGS